MLRQGGDDDNLSFDITLTDDPNEEAKFKREASCMRRLYHKHIVRFVGMSTRGPLHIVTEFMELGDLRSYLRENGKDVQLEGEFRGDGSCFRSMC